MPIAVKCACGANLQAKDDLAGKVAQCPKCSGRVTVPDVSRDVPPAGTRGWPAFAVTKVVGYCAADAERLQQVIDRSTGLEAAIEQITAQPYERLVLLLLCHESKANPQDVPLNSPLLRPQDFGSGEGLPGRKTTQYGIDPLDVAEAMLAAESLLGIRLPDEDPEETTVSSLARQLEEHHTQQR